MRRSFLALAALLTLVALASRAARADEFTLTDGSKIVGSVVGYQGNSFKVKTSYGYALVERDKIVSIKIDGAPEPAAEKKPESDAPKPAKPEKSVAKREEQAKSEKRAPAKAPEKSAVALNANPAPAKPSTPPAAVVDSPSPAPASATPAATAAAATPAAPPEPQPIREKVTGNTYVNDTYEFEMYKPPDWQVMDGARSVLPGAVAAMGTDDQSTYLVIGQEAAAGKSASADIAATQKRLSDILVNYRPQQDERLTIAGSPLIAHRFRGSMDEHDWSGFMVFMPRGDKLYTIFGMTRADNDLVQIQENVIRRTISSFQFLQ